MHISNEAVGGISAGDGREMCSGFGGISLKVHLYWINLNSNPIKMKKAKNLFSAMLNAHRVNIEVLGHKDGCDATRRFIKDLRRQEKVKAYKKSLEQTKF